MLLSVVDHYNRTCKGAANKRAVGSLCGEYRDGNIHITNSFAVTTAGTAAIARIVSERAA